MQHIEIFWLMIQKYLIETMITKKIKIIEALDKQFRQPTINKIYFETSDNIFRCLTEIEQFILQKIKQILF